MFFRINMKNKKNLILTIIQNYDYPFVEPFIKSLKDTGYNGDLIIYVSENVSKTTKFLLKKNRAKLILFRDEFPFIKQEDNLFEGIPRTISINNFRFLFYLEFLKRNTYIYENVLLTDVRDVIFQKEPFQSIEKNKIYFFLEDCKQTFENSELNFLWYKDAFDLESAKSILLKTVSCAGVTIGNSNLIIEYLEYIKEKLMFRNELNWGLDQGIHNGYIYNRYAKNFEVIDNSFPMVLTLGACIKYKFNDLGKLVNDNNEVYPIVHQYDRIQSLMTFFKKKYIGSRLIQIFKRFFFILMP